LAGHVTPIGESRSLYRVLVGKPEGKTSLGRPRCRWEDNIKIDLQEAGLDYFGSGERQVVGACECGNGHLGLMKCGEFLD
jgi:hypothetical protein